MHCASFSTPSPPLSCCSSVSRTHSVFFPPSLSPSLTPCLQFLCITTRKELIAEMAHTFKLSYALYFILYSLLSPFLCLSLKRKELIATKVSSNNIFLLSTSFFAPSSLPFSLSPPSSLFHSLLISIFSVVP